MLNRNLFIFALALLSVAVVAAAASAGPSPSYDPNTAWTALWYAKVSSCTNAAAVRSWTCGPSCDHFPNFQMKGTYTNKTYNDLAFVGFDPDRKWIVVSHQGSEDLEEWLTDADIKQVPASQIYPGAPADAMVHRGFLHEWLSYSVPVLNDVNALLAQHPDTVAIMSVGHSLGGAASLLAGLSIIQNLANSTNSVPVRVYTYGEPRVGNPAFAAWAQQYGFSTIHRQFRVTHARDPVPHMPFLTMFGKHWLHVPQEIWYDNNGNTTYKLCTGNAEQGKEDPKCSDSILPIDPLDHTHYLGVCTGCSCSSEDEAKLRLKAAKMRKSPRFHAMVKHMMDDQARRGQ